MTKTYTAPLDSITVNYLYWSKYVKLTVICPLTCLPLLQSGAATREICFGKCVPKFGWEWARVSVAANAPTAVSCLHSINFHNFHFLPLSNQAAGLQALFPSPKC